MLRVRVGRDFAPQHAELEAGPGESKGRHVAIAAQPLKVGAIGRFGLAEIRQQRAERHQILQAAGRFRRLAPKPEHPVEVSPAGLVDRKPEPVDRFARRARRHGRRQMGVRIGEAMLHRRDLREDQRDMHRRVPDRFQPIGKHAQPVQRGDIAEKLRGDVFLLDHRLGQPRMLRRLPEPGPGATPRALVVEHGNRPGGRHRESGQGVAFGGGRRRHSAAPKRFSRPPRPTFRSVSMIVRATMSG